MINKFSQEEKDSLLDMLVDKDSIENWKKEEVHSEKKEPKLEESDNLKELHENNGIYKSPIRNQWKNVGGFLPNQYINKSHPEGHNGLDYAAAKGTPVYAIGPGEVILATFYPKKSGNCVKISHENGNMTSFYAHLDSYSVSLGEEVDENTIIGTVGSSGNASSPHLHWETKINGNYVNPNNIIGKQINFLKKSNKISKIEKYSEMFLILCQNYQKNT